MNSAPTFAIFVVVLFAYNGTPTQGQTLNVDEAVFKNGQKCFSNPDKRRHTTLTKYWDSPNWELKETTPLRKVTELSIEMKNFHTMLWNTVILDTNKGPLRIQLSDVQEAQQLYDLVDLPTRSAKHFMYRITGLYKYGEGRLLQYGASFSGYAIRGNHLAHRYTVHTGGTIVSLPLTRDDPIQPFLLWTTNGFNYCKFDKKSIVVTLFNSVDGTYDYYLIPFTYPLDYLLWKRTWGKGEYISTRIPKADADPKIFADFRKVYKYYRSTDSDTETED